MGLLVTTLRLRRINRYKMKLLVLLAVASYVFSDCPPPPKDPVECKGADLMCGGEEGPDGCPTANWCMPVDPYAACSSRATCPIACPEGTMMCGGGKDAEDCPMPDTCVPMNDECPTNCPVYCGEDQMHCPGGWDWVSKCPMQDTCVPLN